MGMPPSSAASNTLCRCQSGSDDVQASHHNKKHGEAKRTNISSAQIIGQEHYTWFHLVLTLYLWGKHLQPQFVTVES